MKNTNFRIILLLGLAIPRTTWADGAVYAMTNALVTNQIKVWARAANGNLTPLQTIDTGGGGSGTQLDPTDSLGSQGGLALDLPGRHLIAVNTESLAVDPVGGSGVHDCQMGTISSFVIGFDGRLTLADRVVSGGLFPDSVTVQGDRVFVLNSGGPGLSPSCGVGPNITGFRVNPNGHLSAIPHSTQEINPGMSPGFFLNCDPGGFPTPQFQCGENPPAFPRSPGQVKFTPSGKALVVTVKATNSIYVFPVGANDRPGTPAIWQASGPDQPTYFGFSFDLNGNLIVSEPFGATPTIPAQPKSAVSSFAIGSDGVLQPISPDVPNGRGLSCWVAIDPLTLRYAFVANNGTNDISSYLIGLDGRLTLLNAMAGAAHSPNDMAVALDSEGSLLYALNASTGTVGAWKINLDGSLTPVGTFAGMPAGAGAQGLAAY
jgi:6-phosphogluconolactonase (cycloisomerase 2 family)